MQGTSWKFGAAEDRELEANPWIEISLPRGQLLTEKGLDMTQFDQNQIPWD